MFNKMIGSSNGVWQPGAIILRMVAGNGKLMKEWNGSKREFRNIRWNKQGTYLATASDALRIWSKNGKLLYTGKPHGNSVLWGNRVDQ